MRLQFPDGSTADVSLRYPLSTPVDYSAGITNLAIWELFESNGTTTTAAEIGAIWADSRRRRPGQEHSSPVRRFDGCPTVGAPFNASGQVLFRADSCDVHVVTMVGNVTGWYISPARRAWQEIEIHFVQDATGGRTIGAPLVSPSWVRLAAPWVATAGPGRRDILRLRTDFQGTTWFETGRSLNVGP